MCLHPFNWTSDNERFSILYAFCKESEVWTVIIGPLVEYPNVHWFPFREHPSGLAWVTRSCSSLPNVMQGTIWSCGCWRRWGCTAGRDRPVEWHESSNSRNFRERTPGRNPDSFVAGNPSVHVQSNQYTFCVFTVHSTVLSACFPVSKPERCGSGFGWFW